MSVDSTLAAGRRSIERLMTSSCRITRLTLDTLDEETLNQVDTDPSDDEIYVGPCRVRSLISRVTTKDIEGQLTAIQQPVLQLPVLTSGGVRVGDTVTMTDGGEDPSLTGRTFIVRGLHSQTQATSHRFPIEELD